MKTARFTKALTIALNSETYEQIKQITDAEQISIAEWVRNAVDTALGKYQQKGDLRNGQ